MSDLPQVDNGLVKRALKKAFGVFFKSDIPQILKNNGKRIASPVRLSIHSVKFIKRNGIQESSKVAVDSTKKALRTSIHIPGRIFRAGNFVMTEIRKDFENRDLRQIAEYMACFLSCWIGIWYGNQIPDKDWKVSAIQVGNESLSSYIGGHRNFIFHSAIMAVAIDILGRLILRICTSFREELSDSNHDAKALFVGIEKQLTLVVYGAHLGVAAHLAKDALVDGHKSVEFPGTGTLIYGSFADDRAYLLINSVLAILNGQNIPSLKEAGLSVQQKKPKKDQLKYGTWIQKIEQLKGKAQWSLSLQTS